MLKKSKDKDKYKGKVIKKDKYLKQIFVKIFQVRQNL